MLLTPGVNLTIAFFTRTSSMLNRIQTRQMNAKEMPAVSKSHCRQMIFFECEMINVTESVSVCDC
jgi:hypothetical protein